MSNVKISGFPVPFALPVGTPNGTEVYPADQTVSGTLQTVSVTVAALFGGASIAYTTGAGLSITGASASNYSFTMQAVAGQSSILTVAGNGNANGVILQQDNTSTGYLRNTAGTMYFGAGSQNAIGIVTAGNVTISAPTSGVSLAINGAANAAYGASVTISAPNTASQSNGLLIKAGTNSSDAPLVVSNATDAINFLAILGDSSWSFSRAASTPTLASSAAGNITISVPSSGAALTVNGSINSSSGIQLTGYATTFTSTIGVEIGISGGIGYMQTYNRGTSAYQPTAITGSTISLLASNTSGLIVGSGGTIQLNAVATTTTAPGAGGAGALPATPAGYFTITIGATARKVPYY